ncbi:MAG: nitroreductase family protein [Gammaproteobacteria bacterium AqS3]|nr:nitroreductase family protein [Gammaproteobacteria bacterium AqS3]
MKVSEALANRKSVRAFLDRPIPQEVLRSVLERSARAPSGGNLQPWRIYVLSGARQEAFREAIRKRLADNPVPDSPAEYSIYPEKLKAPYRDSRFKVGEDLYGLLGIPREDKAGRMGWFQRNYEFFGAPTSMFCYVDKQMGPPQWSDLGMFLQSVMLLLQEEGIDTCAQECWSLYHQSVRELLGVEEPEWILFCGMSVGYRDGADPVNRLVTDREPLENFATFLE